MIKIKLSMLPKLLLGYLNGLSNLPLSAGVFSYVEYLRIRHIDVQHIPHRTDIKKRLMRDIVSPLFHSTKIIYYIGLYSAASGEIEKRKLNQIFVRVAQEGMLPIFDRQS